MLNEFTRMEMLVGEDGIRCLSSAKIAVFGLGGVGSYVAEALARCGLGLSLIHIFFHIIYIPGIP